MKQIGVWRSWLAHLVWDQRVQCSSHCTPTKRMIFGSSFFVFIILLNSCMIHSNLGGVDILGTKSKTLC